jgi:branched-chain amino acid transport system permease protein
LEIFAPLLQYLISGLTNGAIYALIALGFGIIYNATTIINFAQGEMVMVGALCAISIYHLAPSLPLAFTGAVVLVTFWGLVFERLALRPVKDPSPITLIIITVGGAVLIKGVAMLLWGKDAYTLPPFSGNVPIHLGPATILPQNLWVLGITAIAVTALEAFFRLTLVGKAMRACAYNTRAARLVGIAAGRMVQLSFGVSAALGAGAGILIAPLTLGVYDMGTMLGLKGFSAAIIGGLGSLAGPWPPASYPPATGMRWPFSCSSWSCSCAPRVWWGGGNDPTPVLQPLAPLRRNGRGDRRLHGPRLLLYPPQLHRHPHPVGGGT